MCFLALIKVYRLLFVFCYLCLCYLVKMLLDVHLVGCGITREGVPSPFSLQSLRVPWLWDRSDFSACRLEIWAPCVLHQGLFWIFVQLQSIFSANDRRHLMSWRTCISPPASLALGQKWEGSAHWMVRMFFKERSDFFKECLVFLKEGSVFFKECSQVKT